MRSCDGKKSGLRIGAMKPKSAKSYHSMTLPIMPAITVRLLQAGAGGNERCWCIEGRIQIPMRWPGWARVAVERLLRCLRLSIVMLTY